jgi:hypothetical protein
VPGTLISADHIVNDARQRGTAQAVFLAPQSARWMRRLSTSIEEKARSAAHVRVLETAEEL